MQIGGSFAYPPLLRLSPEDLDFVLAFVRASGSLKECARRMGRSYPTVRNRLDGIIEVLEAGDETADKRRAEILDAIATGKLSVKEATKQLEALKR